MLTRVCCNDDVARAVIIQACARMKPAQNKMAADAKQLLPRVLKVITVTGDDGQQFAGALPCLCELYRCWCTQEQLDYVSRSGLSVHWDRLELPLRAATPLSSV